MFNAKFVATLAVVTGLLAGVEALAQDRSVSISDAGRLECNVAGFDPPACVLNAAANAKYRSLRAEVITTEETVEAVFLPFSDPASAVSHDVILLVDDSTNLRSLGGANARLATLGRVKESVLAAFDALPPGSRAALVKFSDNTETLVGFGADREAIAQGLGSVRFEGLQTRTFDAIREAIRSLSEQRGQTKTVLLFTDGLAEDVETQLEAVSMYAADQDVAVSTFIVHYLDAGVEERGGALSPFASLAAESGGLVAEVGPETRGDVNVIERFGALMREQAASSGIITVPGLNRDVRISIEMEVNAQGGQPNRANYRTVTAQLEPNLPAPPVEPPEPTPEPTWDPWMIYAAIALVVLLLLLALYMLFRPKPEPEIIEEHIYEYGSSDDDDEGPTRLTPAGDADQGPVLARLSMGDGRQYDVRVTRVSIGRGSDNMVVLKNDSISRNHAELHLNRDGAFAITDLGSLNHTRVNGEIVATQALNDGDRLQFGELEVVFQKVDP